MVTRTTKRNQHYTKSYRTKKVIPASQYQSINQSGFISDSHNMHVHLKERKTTKVCHHIQNFYRQFQGYVFKI